MTFKLRTAAFALAGLASFTIPTSSALADGWGRNGHSARHHTTHGGYRHSSYARHAYSSGRSHVPRSYSRTHYVAPVVRERAIVRRSTTYVTQYARTVVYSGGSSCR